jgi:hypothetical protein
VFVASFLALAVSSLSDLNAAARAEGNRKPLAIQVGKALLRTVWPAQVMKIRVDGVGPHEVAGIVVSGVKFHSALDPASFTAEIVALVRQTFAASDVEEVDIWATVPLPYVPQVPVDGEYLQPTTRIVYAATVERPERASFAARLERGDDVYWDPAWRRSLPGAAAARP